MPSPMCVVCNGLSDYHFEQNFCHSSCIYKASHLCVFAGDQRDLFIFSNVLITMSALMLLLTRVFSGAAPNYFLQQNSFHKGCIYMASPMYVFSRW